MGKLLDFMGWGKEWRERGSKGLTLFDRGAYRNQFESVLRQWAQGPPKWIYKFSIQQVVPFLKHSFPGKKKFQTLLADAMHTFMTTTLIKKLNIWGLGFLCPPVFLDLRPKRQSIKYYWFGLCLRCGLHLAVQKEPTQTTTFPSKLQTPEEIIPFVVVSDAGPTSWPHHSKLAPLRIQSWPLSAEPEYSTF